VGAVPDEASAQVRLYWQAAKPRDYGYTQFMTNSQTGLSALIFVSPKTLE